jgi:hypothetical protein
MDLVAYQLDLVTGGCSFGTFSVPITVPKPRRMMPLMMFLDLIFLPRDFQWLTLVVPRLDRENHTFLGI